MDTLTPAQRSKLMGRIRGKDTGPEVALRSTLHRLGLRFRKNVAGIPGTPDVCHRTARVAVFVDGCFWHGCPKHYKRPKSRQQFWDTKLSYNLDLRRRVLARLRAEQWRYVRIWECQVRDSPRSAAARVIAAIRSRPPSTSRARDAPTRGLFPPRVKAWRPARVSPAGADSPPRLEARWPRPSSARRTSSPLHHLD